MNVNVNCETYDADDGRVELDIAEAAELGGFPGQVLGVREVQLLCYVWEIHLPSRVRRIVGSGVRELSLEFAWKWKESENEMEKKTFDSDKVSGECEFWIFNFSLLWRELTGFSFYRENIFFGGKSELIKRLWDSFSAVNLHTKFKF